MGSKVAAPEPRNYGEETRDTLQAQLDLAPAKFAAEQQFAPQYQQMQLDMMRNAAPQLMSMYEQDIAPGLSRTEVESRRMSREGDIADVARLGPQARAAIAAGSPQEAAMVESMMKSGQAGLDAGTGLTPEDTRRAQQASRQAFAARGMAGGPNAALDEVMRTQMGGQQAQMRRQGQAGMALAQSKGLYGDQFQAVLGRPSQAFGAMQGFGAQAQGFNPGQLFNPESQYAADINNQGWQGALSANTASAANKTALIGAGISAAGSAASAL